MRRRYLPAPREIRRVELSHHRVLDDDFARQVIAVAAGPIHFVTRAIELRKSLLGLKIGVADARA
jgi:hypothetical protein